MKNLKVEYRPLDGLIPYANNARTHSDEQIAEIAASIAEFGFVNPILLDEAEEEEEEIPELPEEPNSKHGDVWILGDHRVLCGDATVVTDIEKLMDGQLADMVFTDPPYNVDYGNTAKGKQRKASKGRGGKNAGRTIMNDNLGEAFEQFLYDAITNMLMVTRKDVGGSLYICMSSSELHTLQRVFITAGGKWSTFIVWAKNHFTLGRADYQRQYEPILYGWKEGNDRYWCGAPDPRGHDAPCAFITIKFFWLKNA